MRVRVGMRRASIAWALAAVVLGALVSACADPAAPATASRQATGIDTAPAVESALRGGRGSALDELTSTERAQLAAVYEAGGGALLWVDAAHHPGADAREALRLLGAASREGLDPQDYRAPSLTDTATMLTESAAPPLTSAVAFDVDLSASTALYLRDLHTGRVDPRDIGFRMQTRRDEHDFPALVRSAVAAHRIADTAAEMTPQLTLYRGLREALVRYRSLAADTALEPLPPLAATVRPGETYAGLPELRRRLVVLGDLPPDAPSVASTVYEGGLVDGVKRFQARHGLDPDGIMGRTTQAALRVPLAWRVRQLELGLERLRWLPHLGKERLLAVNVPMFQLWGWDSIFPNGVPAFDMRVVVGRALNTETPVFIEEMRRVIFRPYWNVPRSILRGEILPAVRRNPEYLARQNMEIVSGQSDDAQPVALTPESLAQLERGGLRVRQRPGEGNALGLVKFVFPNDENVYMHGTPATQLFSRQRRDFSHGCIRVEDPVGLAEWVLKGQGDWDRARILQAMNETDSNGVELNHPIQVILFYITAVVMPETGEVRFADDIYNHDNRLDRALTRRR